MVIVAGYSFHEKEYRAAFLAIVFALIFSSPPLLVSLFEFKLKLVFSILMLIDIALLFIVFLFPDLKRIPHRPGPITNIDERTIMFSRNELKSASEKYNKFYEDYPELEDIDKSWRKLPGLLSPGSKYYSPLQFKKAQSIFNSVDSLQSLVEGSKAADKTLVHPKEISLQIKELAKRNGAFDSGICLLKDYHKYSIVGRGEQYGEKVELNHEFAIALVVEMNQEMVSQAPQAPIVIESATQYFNSGQVAVKIAEYIRLLGYDARAHIDANYRVICPLVAADAGLGEIGRMGLLIHPRLGPRCRIAVITTNLPLIPDKSKYDHSVDKFCSLCKKCAENCPSASIPKGEKEKIDDVLRWRISQEKCFGYWCKVGTDCGICMKKCPYSHPNNLFHRSIRFGIKHFVFFRRFAVFMDDLFYGK